jgi:ribosomal protein S18 acetylase RimI-like enzyme
MSDKTKMEVTGAPFIKKANVEPRTTAVVPIDRDTYFGLVNHQNIQQLRALNRAILPVPYPESFYKDMLTNRPSLTKLVYYKDVIVGAVCCKIEREVEEDDAKEGDAKADVETEKRLCILTLALLAPYRNRGIGTKLLAYVMAEASRLKVSSVYLHVQTNNDLALNFYKKNGFEVTETIEKYYPRLDPPSCHVLTKQVERVVEEVPEPTDVSTSDAPAE